jgi:hypothetical protein
VNSTFGDRAADGLGAILEVGQREVHDRRAGVAGQDARAAVVGHERANWGRRLPPAVRDMEDLQIAARNLAAERKRDPPQLGGELLVRQPGDKQRAVHVDHVGDSRGADRLTQYPDSPLADLEFLALVAQRERGVQPLVGLGRSVADGHLGNGYVIQRDVGDRTVEAADPHQHRLGSGAVAALDRQVHVVRQRVDRHVLDHDVAGLAAQEGADPRVDVLEVERPRPRPPGPGPRYRRRTASPRQSAFEPRTPAVRRARAASASSRIAALLFPCVPSASPCAGKVSFSSGGGPLRGRAGSSRPAASGMA